MQICGVFSGIYTDLDEKPLLPNKQKTHLSQYGRTEMCLCVFILIIILKTTSYTYTIKFIIKCIKYNVLFTIKIFKP